MTGLVERSPGAGLLPLSIGGMTAAERANGVLTAIAPYRGQDQACSAALQAAHGMALPEPNRMTVGAQESRAIWFGQRMALLIGPAPDRSLARHAALSDQSDAWAVVRLDGMGADAVLARLTPLDLRPGVFKPGHTARSDLAHMAASVTRLEVNTWEIMVFRSYARSFVHEVKTAMESVAARAPL